MLPAACGAFLACVSSILVGRGVVECEEAAARNWLETRQSSKPLVATRGYRSPSGHRHSDAVILSLLESTEDAFGVPSSPNWPQDHPAWRRLKQLHLAGVLERSATEPIKLYSPSTDYASNERFYIQRRIHFLRV